MVQGRIGAVVLLALLAAAGRAPATGAADEELAAAYTNDSYGFRVSRPDASWTLKEEAGTGSFTLILEPPGVVGAVQVRILVETLAAPREAAAARDQALAGTKGKAEYSDQETTTREIAGRAAPGVAVNVNAFGQVFHLRMAYLVEDGRQYSLQCHAPKAAFKDYGQAFDAVWGSFEFVPVNAEAKALQALAALAARCGSEIDWARSWPEAAERARNEKKLVLVRVKWQGGFKISDDADAGCFMDPDVLGLLKTRLVCLRLQKGMDAPFLADDAYGMGPHTFGASVLLVLPDGQVVGDTFCTEAAAFCDFLRSHLDRHPEQSGERPPAGLAGAERAQWHLRRGEYDRAAALLQAAVRPGDVALARLKVELQRRVRAGTLALAEIGRAREAAALPAEAAADLLADEAVILMRTGRFEEAQAAFERLVREHPACGRIPEALYWSGALKLRLSGKEAAEPVWKGLIASHEEDRWAWKAAGIMASTGYSAGQGERLDWPPAEVMETLKRQELKGLALRKASEAEKAALAFVLSRQRPDGSWISPFEAEQFTDKEPSDFTMAITAVCGLSLLPHRQAAGAEEALRRACAYLLAGREREKAAGKAVYFMDYTVYSKAYTLWFLARSAEAGLVAREEAAAALDELVAEIEANQKPGGGWSYYVTTDLAQAGKPSNQSISFVTALETVALLEAVAAGVAVPDEMTAKALSCLERMRNPDGTFEYFLFHDNEGAARNTPAAGAAGRGPLCSLALYKGGRGGLDMIRGALDAFLEHRGTYAKEQGKSLMHCGLAGQGSHYLMFDYAFAAAAVRELPEKERAKYRRPLLELILGARSAEGSFLDNPFNGPHYATAMALSAFDALRPLR